MNNFKKTSIFDDLPKESDYYTMLNVSQQEFEMIKTLRIEENAKKELEYSLKQSFEEKYGEIDIFNKFEKSCFEYYKIHKELTEKQVSAFRKGKRNSYSGTRYDCNDYEQGSDWQSAFGY